MNCFHCKEKAELKCICSQILYCPHHIGLHMDNSGQHIVEILGITLTLKQSSDLQQVLSLRIQQIEEAEKLIILESKKNVAIIESLTKNLLGNLENLAEKYISFLSKKSYTKPEYTEIEGILKTALEIRPISNEICFCLEEKYTKDCFVIKNKEQEIKEGIKVNFFKSQKIEVADAEEELEMLNKGLLTKKDI